MTEVHVRKPITRTKKQKLTKEMFDRLKENPDDPEARRWMKELSISYVYLSENGKSVEVRI